MTAREGEPWPGRRQLYSQDNGKGKILGGPSGRLEGRACNATSAGGGGTRGASTAQHAAPADTSVRLRGQMAAPGRAARRAGKGARNTRGGSQSVSWGWGQGLHHTDGPH